MDFLTGKIQFNTNGNSDIKDLTADVEKILAEYGYSEGNVLLFVPGSTAALTTIEFEPGLLKDYPEFMERLIPSGKIYHHDMTWHDGNGHSHLQATLLGPSLTVPVGKGKLLLGTWQQITHVECDIHSRDRTVVVTVMGE